MEKIIILFGSFNPVTIAHYSMLQNALDVFEAKKGLLVASSGSYLKKKTTVKKATPFILEDEVREEMLRSLSVEDERMSFWGYELGGATPNSAGTIKKIIKQYPNHEIYFLCGADKVRSLYKWNDFDDIIKKIQFIVYKRDDINLDEVIENDKILNLNKDRIHIIEAPLSVLGISSSILRKKFFNNEDYSSLMNPSTYRILQRYSLEDFKEPTFEEKVYNVMKYGGMRAGYQARGMVYNDNVYRFNNWDSDVLGDKDSKINNTKVYKEEFVVNSDSNFETTFDCYNEDAVEVAFDLVKNGYNPAILNLASNYRPCGGYDDLKNAQEESLCFSSTLSVSLYQFGKSDTKGVIDLGINNPISGVYPLDINFGGIYSPKVCFFRNNKYKHYSIREDIFECDVITVASLSNREKKDWYNPESIYFNPDGTMTSEGIEIEKNKIRTIYRIGLDNNNDSLVLGAFGCGVFRVLPEEVSKLFMEVLNEAEFKNKYKRIVFAILESRKRGAIVGKDGKFKPFYELWHN